MREVFSTKKYWRIRDINAWNLNETLTNGVDSFEKPGPDLLDFRLSFLALCIVYSFSLLSALSCPGQNVYKTEKNDILLRRGGRCGCGVGGWEVGQGEI